MDFETYEILKNAVSSKYKPRLLYNKRIDSTHKKLDLVFIDGYYKTRDEIRDRKKKEFELRAKKHNGGVDDENSGSNSDDEHSGSNSNSHSDDEHSGSHSDDENSGSNSGSYSHSRSGEQVFGSSQLRRHSKNQKNKLNCDHRIYSFRGEYNNKNCNKKEMMAVITVII